MSNATGATEPAAPRADSAADGLPGFTHRYAEVNGTTLHYVSGGAGPAVVLLHGWPLSWREWRGVMPALAAAGFTVVAPDLRGLGDSARPADGYDKRTVAEDVRQLVQTLGHREVNLVGTDIGMMAAFAWALRHPTEVRRLVLAESLLPGFGLEELMNPATGGYWHFGFHMQVGVAEMLTAGREAAYLGPMWNLFSPYGGITAADRADHLRTYTGPGGMRAGFQHYAALLADGTANRAAFRDKLPMPVLVLSAEKGIPQGQTLGCAGRVAARVEADTVPRAGHAFAADNPAWTADRLIRFFTKDDSP